MSHNLCAITYVTKLMPDQSKIPMQDNKQQMENLQQGIEALNVDIGGGEQSDVSLYHNYTHHVIVMT